MILLQTPFFPPAWALLLQDNELPAAPLERFQQLGALGLGSAAVARCPRTSPTCGMPGSCARPPPYPLLLQMGEVPTWRARFPTLGATSAPPPASFPLQAHACRGEGSRVLKC